MDSLPNNGDYLLTLFEVCEILGKSSRTVTRYVHRHILHPRGIKSRQGTLEYRFSKAEVLDMKNNQDFLGRYNTEVTEDKTQSVPMATFANLAYPPAVQQSSAYIIPGISFPGAVANTETARLERHEAKNEPADTVKEPVAKVENIIQKKSSEESVIAAEAHVIDGRSNSEGEIITLLKSTTEMLRDQLKTKDEQIKNLDDKIGQLIERNRETNILLKGLQDKMVLLEKPKIKDHSRAERADQNQSSRVAVSQDNSPRPAPAPDVSENAEASDVASGLSVDVSDKSDTLANLVPNPPMAGERFVPRAGDNKAEPIAKKGLFGKFFG